jgi:tetratricopeptide (TPR) repeat protein
VLLQAIPVGPLGDQLLPEACAASKSVDLRIQCFRRAAERAPLDQKLKSELVTALFRGVREESALCAGQLAGNCIAEIEQVARKMLSIDPASSVPKYYMAKVLVARGQPYQALVLFDSACPSDGQDLECSRDFVNTAMRFSSPEQYTAAIEKYVTRACSNPAACADALDWVAGMLDKADNKTLALKYYEKAAEADGTAPRWFRIAQLAVSAKMLSLAYSALERAERAPGMTEKLAQRIQHLHAAVTNGMLAHSL